ncbi:MAG: alpha/beta fold hydrolase [Candidatus Heimdallarchaeota archaeon]|nr:alpha/beta fold hydrolase [Candidatus Heimdallarchaeota archaeon]
MPQIEIEDGLQISYILEGDLSKPTVVLVNGSIFNYKQFDPVLLPALKKFLGDDYSYLRYDYVGISNSSELEGEFDFKKIAEQHKQLLDALKIEQAHHFGYSKGSLISFLVAGLYPDKVKSIAGYGNPNLDLTDNTTKQNFVLRRQALASISGIWNKAVDDNNYGILYDAVFLPLVFPGKSVQTLSFKDKIKNRVVKPKFKPMLMDTKIENIEKLYRYYTQQNPTEEELKAYIELMKSLKQPVLLMHGTADEVVPISSSEKLHDWIPHSDYKVFNNYKHSEPVLVKKMGTNIMSQLASFIKSQE